MDGTPSTYKHADQETYWVSQEKMEKLHNIWIVKTQKMFSQQAPPRWIENLLLARQAPILPLGYNESFSKLTHSYITQMLVAN